MSSKARRKRLMTGFVHSERPDLVCGRCMHVWTGPTSMRLDALLSSVVGVKVKEAQAMVASGEVTVGGAVQCEPRWQIVLGEEASVSVHGQPLLSLGKRPFAHRVLLVHKPRGVCCERFRGSAAWAASRGGRPQLDDHQTARRSLWDLVPSEEAHATLGCWGRLDADTSGLILMGTDGGLQSLLMHPTCGCEKSYLASLRIDGALRLRPTATDEFASGVQLADGYTCRPARLEVVDSVADPDGADVPFPSRVRITLVEGQYHQVKRMLGACGAAVCALHRERIGALSLDDYPELAVEGSFLRAGAREEELLRTMLPLHRVAERTNGDRAHRDGQPEVPAA